MRGKSQAMTLLLVGEEAAHLQVQTASCETSQSSCANLHQILKLIASAPSRSPELNRRKFTYVDAETISCSGAEGSTQPALQSLWHWILHALVVFIVLCHLLWKLRSLLAFRGTRSSQQDGDFAHHNVRELYSKVISYQMLLLPAVHLFSPWLNNHEIEIVCSHPSSSSFICMNRKENLGFHCNAIHKSLLESITLISSYSTTKKTRKNKNKGELSMWLLSFAASRLLRNLPGCSGCIAYL